MTHTHMSVDTHTRESSRNPKGGQFIRSWGYLTSKLPRGYLFIKHVSVACFSRYLFIKHVSLACFSRYLFIKHVSVASFSISSCFKMSDLLLSTNWALFRIGSCGWQECCHVLLSVVMCCQVLLSVVMCYPAATGD
ncbi:hypothetical protein BsWGS_13323 [Bradybaena similaris]